ncbi:hypothetical protein Pyn_10527 [Prunus yedoensis var. nudiflora]|uniref:Uncharacterized protein n=1 Tax=Prunus yedoensis var. nudiflora TaxID=2094558 RepID=A0A314UC49_PRUYE|nr:hypothetical protein Pyn_10527 [Prunus yedoensis var. nudiflora]
MTLAKVELRQESVVSHLSLWKRAGSLGYWHNLELGSGRERRFLHQGLGVSGLGTCCAVQQGAMWAWVEPRVLRQALGGNLQQKPKWFCKFSVCCARIPKGLKGRGCRRHRGAECELRQWGAEGELRHGGAEGGTKLECCKAMSFGAGVLKAQGCRRQRDADGDTKLACCKAMCLGTGVPMVSLGEGVPKTKECRRRHKACMLHEGVERQLWQRCAESELRHSGAKGGTQLACCKAMNLGTGVPKVSLGTEMLKSTQSLHVARQ